MTAHTLSSHAHILDRMLDGFVPLEDHTAALDLTVAQRVRLKAIIFAVDCYRRGVLPLRRGRTRALDIGLRRATGMRIRVPRHDLPHGEGTHYLDEASIADFERTGLIRPFDVMTPEQAEALRQFSLREFEGGFDGKLFIQGDLSESLTRTDDLHIGLAGLYQALQYPELRAALRAPAIAQRMASLLGDQVVCWRSQFFQKNPGDQGTFWHQTGAFREVNSEAKLVPTRPASHGILQLTAWIALTDVTLANGAMRMMPGSFGDGRIEFLQGFAQDDLLDYLARMPRESLPRLLKAALFTSGSFIKSQAIFETTQVLLGDMFAGREVVDLEMKAGQAVIFTSMNLHASSSNTTRDGTRLSLVGRYTANHVRVFPGQQRSYQATAEGVKGFSTAQLSCFQVHGHDTYGYNRILEEG